MRFQRDSSFVQAPASKVAGVQSKKIFVGGLNATTNNHILAEYFKKFGTVECVNVLEDSATNRNRGFAYVTFADSDTADKVVCEYHRSSNSSLFLSNISLN